MRDLTGVKTNAHSLLAIQALERARDYARAASADSTQAAYAKDWGLFTAFCDGQGLESLPADPATICAFVSWMADTGRRPATIKRCLTVVRKQHARARLLDPTTDERVVLVVKGVRRKLGAKQLQKKPALAADVTAMVRDLPETLAGLRDRAMLLIGFAGALRRSELVAIKVEHLVFEPDGVIVIIPTSKTDQEGDGQEVSISFGRSPETCPVRCLQRWLGTADLKDGPVFRRIWKGGRLADHAVRDAFVAELVKARAAAVGLDPLLYSGHSLRAGFATQAARNGCRDLTIMRQTRHKDVATFMRYVREGQRWEDNASKGIGL